MKTKVVLIVCSCLLLLSCSEDEPIDLEDLQWLKVEIDNMQQSSIAEYLYIEEAQYKKNRVFIFENCCPFCNTVVAVYAEEGELLGYLGDDIAADKLKDVKLFWQPDNAACIQ